MSGTPWHKGLAGKSASLASRQGSSCSHPPARPHPQPCSLSQARAGPRSRLALAHCFQNSFIPILPGVFKLFEAESFSLSRLGSLKQKKGVGALMGAGGGL